MKGDFFSVLLQLLLEELPSGMATVHSACASQITQVTLYELMLLVILDWSMLLVILDWSMLLVLSQVYSHQRRVKMNGTYETRTWKMNGTYETMTDADRNESSGNIFLFMG